VPSFLVLTDAREAYGVKRLISVDKIVAVENQSGIGTAVYIGPNLHTDFFMVKEPIDVVMKALRAAGVSFVTVVQGEYGNE